MKDFTHQVMQEKESNAVAEHELGSDSSSRRLKPEGSPGEVLPDQTTVCQVLSAM